MTDMYQDSTRTSGRWLFPHKQDLGHAMLATGIGATTYGLTTVGYPSLVLPLASTVAGMILCERGWTMWRKGDEPPMDDMPMMDDFGMGMGYPGMPDWGMGGNMPEMVSRVLEVAQATWPDELEPVWSEFEMDGDVLMKYAFRATKPGFFSEEGTKTRVVNKLSSALDGGWASSFDMRTDTVSMTQRSALPALLVPEPETMSPNPWYVVKTEEEAGSHNLTFKWTPGVGEDGNYIWFNPREFPHIGIYGTTGGGKSVTVRAILEQFRAAGFQLFLGDGKNIDYGNYKGIPGVSAVASTLEEQVILVSIVRRLMDQRRAQGNKMATNGVSRAEIEASYQPVLLVLDEFSTTVADLKSNYKDYARFKTDLSAILKVARQCRCHVFICTQDMKDETLPSDLRGMLAATMCMGKPDDMIVRKGFPDNAQGEARRKGDTISKKTRGRGIMAMDTKDGPVVTLFQSFFSFSPAEDVKDRGLKNEVRNKWVPFKKSVTDSIPRLYSRIWVKPELPEEEGGNKKDPYAEAREYFEDHDRIKIAELSVSDMQKFKLVALDAPSTPEEDRKRYDPLSTTYIGGPPVDGGVDEFIDVNLV